MQAITRGERVPADFLGHLLHRFAAFILIGVLNSASILPAFSEEKPDSRRVPNIVLILADDSLDFIPGG
jgi:hypothetical protein